MGHPISSDNGLISQTLLQKSEFYYRLHVTMDVAYSSLIYRVLSQPDLMLYKFVYNTVRAHLREIHVLSNFRLGVELYDAVCFFWLNIFISFKHTFMVTNNIQLYNDTYIKKGCKGRKQVLQKSADGRRPVAEYFTKDGQRLSLVATRFQWSPSGCRLVADW